MLLWFTKCYYLQNLQNSYYMIRVVHEYYRYCFNNVWICEGRAHTYQLILYYIVEVYKTVCFQIDWIGKRLWNISAQRIKFQYRKSFFWRETVLTWFILQQIHDKWLAHSGILYYLQVFSRSGYPSNLVIKVPYIYGMSLKCAHSPARYVLSGMTHAYMDYFDNYIFEGFYL